MPSFLLVKMIDFYGSNKLQNVVDHFVIIVHNFRCLELQPFEGTTVSWPLYWTLARKGLIN